MNYKTVFNEETNYYDIYELDTSTGNWEFLLSVIFKENANQIITVLDYDENGIPFSEGD